MSLLRKQNAVCGAVQTRLEEISSKARGAAALDRLLAGLESSLREHVGTCAACRTAAELHIASSALLSPLRSSRPAAGAWFATRVMAAIAAREKELARVPGLAALLPKYASRLAWAAAVALLVTASWVYTGTKSPTTTPPSANVPESLFETQPGPPQTPDEVLMSLAVTEK
ncbi:MAG TPA: hypothetical protein VFA13_04225 [Candidatus Acidoferrum sp.]|nr:hypothetical protein [Candidatus Acidoferrum sp.]